MTFILREANQSNVETLAHLHVVGGRNSYEGLVDQAYLDSLTEEDFIQRWRNWLQEGVRVVLAEEKETSRICGFCGFGPLKTPPPGSSPIRPQYSSEIYAIYVLPEFWKQGVGKKLMRHCSKALQEEGHNSMCLWVLKGNERAGSFYEKLGGQRIGKHTIEVGPSKVIEVCYGWRDIDAMTAEKRGS